MALTAKPFARSREIETIRAELNKNVSSAERIGSAVAGAGLVLYGASQRSLGGLIVALLGGALIHRGATGHCPLYQQLGIQSGQMNREAGVPGDKGVKVVRSITIRRTPQEIYDYWRNLENLPRFMEHVESVRELDEQRSEWVVRGPFGQDLRWTAEIITDRAGEIIAWESLPGSEVQNAGSVRFQPAASGGTEVRVALKYLPPAGVAGAMISRLLGESPEQQVENDLAQLKSILEREKTPPANGAGSSA